MTHVLESLVSRLLIVCGYILMGGIYNTCLYSGKFGSTSRGGSLQWGRIYNGIVLPNAF